jgi:Flp pilus assembly protein TadD
VLLATAAVFQTVLRHEFLNWDDPQCLVANAALEREGVVAWAFSTTHMSHYQPLSWLAWALLRQLAGASAAAHHAASLLAHLLGAALVFALSWRLGSLAGLLPGPRRAAAVLAASFFALHPLRVEPVAWASAFPYLLALPFLLLALLGYLRYASGSGAAAPLVFSLAAYTLAQLCRAAAPALPLVLLVADLALGRMARVGWRRALLEKGPFALVALLTTLAEARARSFAPIERVGFGARLTDALGAPIVYLARTLWPVELSPLDVQPLAPEASAGRLLASLALLVAASLAAWHVRARRPWVLAGWLAYLLLLAPAAGLTPSGLQASADRYTYVPGVALALLAGAGAARLWSGAARAAWLAAGLALGMALAVQTVRQLGYWRDSVALWTRAVELDPRNDVALYNLALALEAAGDQAGATQRYREVLGLVPDHAPAGGNLARLEALRLEREAGAAAASGRLEEAIGLYGRALEQDPARLHSRRSRGMALAQLGRFEQALPDLQAAVAGGGAEPEVAAALALVLVQGGRRDDAVAVLREAVARHPDVPGLARELARLEDRIRGQ